jgi:hypothetical protein
VKKNLGRPKLLSYFGVDPSSSKVAELLACINRAVHTRHLVAHAKGRLPSASECQRGRRDVIFLLSPTIFGRLSEYSQVVDDLASSKLLHVSKVTAVKYLLLQCLQLVESECHALLERVDGITDIIIV